MSQQIKLVNVTPDAEKMIAYCARVSNPKNQDNEKIDKLLEYCIKHNHWSIFEMANMVVEIETTRAIAAQILRHRSFTFQEFSQRYADTKLIEEKIHFPALRKQDLKNRQNSTDDLDEFVKQDLELKTQKLFESAQDLYNEMLEVGVAKECARMVLPLATPTRIYMNGSVRSWIHYIDLRSAHGTQKEHMEIAEGVRDIFCQNFPIISQALHWN